MKEDRSGVPFFICLLHRNTHRSSQGRLIRRVLFSAIAIVFGLIGQRMFTGVSDLLGHTSAVVLLAFAAAAAGWFAFRLINHQPIADFLIDVQAESSKVTWSNWHELRKTTAIVLAAMFAFSVYLFACDISWQFVLRSLSILNV